MFNSRSLLTSTFAALLAVLSFAAPLASPSLPGGGSFTVVGNMSTARYYHTATLLGNGKVLVAGGRTGLSILKKTDLFDPASGTFTSLPQMNKARERHTATLLPNGKVLFIGGNTTIGFLTLTNTAELFDPSSGTFTLLPGTMNSARFFHTATLLANGKVLITGGLTPSGVTNTAELFDPVSGTFGLVANTMNSLREVHTATLLPNGKVLIAGGFLGSGGATGYLNTAELFDPSAGTFTSLPTMSSDRGLHTAIALANGMVLIAGGFDGTQFLDTAELFDPATGMFTAVSAMNAPRESHTATLLPNGKVLITGGLTEGSTLNTAELFDPETRTFISIVPSTMTSPRYIHTATLLPDGKVLLAGGNTGSGLSDTAEQFESIAPSFTSLHPNTMTAMRGFHTATLLPGGNVLITGGFTGSEYTNTAELFDPASGTFTVLPPMNSPRSFHTATLLPGGNVLIAGGFTGSEYTDTAELFDPASGTFTGLPPMTSPRSFHTAALLPSGKVLMAGGFTGTAYTNTAELFDPASGTFISLPPMTSARFRHTATLLPSGNVLMAGGLTGTAYTNAAELFDPASGNFTSLLNTMTSVRGFHTATLLPSGNVLIAGGFSASGITNTAELFDPALGTFTSLAPNTMTLARVYHTATLLPSGQVLIAGGDTISAGVTVAPTITAELFDPAFGTFTSLAPSTMTSPRSYYTATLLASGKVLLAGGFIFSVNTDIVTTDTAELFDLGLGFSDARRPVVATLPTSLIQPASLILTGSGFRGDSEASGGSCNTSATNYPLLQLTRIDNEQTFFPLSDSVTNWSDTSFSSEMLGAVIPLPAGFYRATVFTNAIPSLARIISIGLPAPVELVSVASRKTHGSAGQFDIDLPITGNPGIECRSGGASDDYTLVFTFTNVLTSVAGASVTSGSGSVASSNVDSSDAHRYLVDVTGVTNAQVITIGLSNVLDSSGASSAAVSASMPVLSGDTTGDGSVNSSDISQTKAQSGQPVTASNFRQDLTVNGSINSSDISLAKSKSGTALP